MIEIYDARQLARDPALKREMHRLRYRIFKLRHKWDVEVRGDQEIDDYDNPGLNPVYFLNRDYEGRVKACWRLLPSTGPNMLRDVFPFLMDGSPVPAALGILEASRFAVEADPTTEAGLAAFNRVTAELLCALGEFGIPRGVREVVTVFDVRVGRLLRRAGARPAWQTKPHRIGNCLAVAAAFEISPRALNTIRETAKVPPEVISTCAMAGEMAAA